MEHFSSFFVFLLDFYHKLNIYILISKEKIQKKGCDYLVANDISRKDIGFSSDMNEVYILDKNLKISHIGRDTKLNIAKQIDEKFVPANVSAL